MNLLSAVAAFNTKIFSTTHEPMKRTLPRQFYDLNTVLCAVNRERMANPTRAAGLGALHKH